MHLIICFRDYCGTLVGAPKPAAIWVCVAREIALLASTSDLHVVVPVTFRAPFTFSVPVIVVVGTSIVTIEAA